MRTASHPLGAWKAASLLFLGLALLLAVASGDTLLVLAVGSAVGGIALLTARRGDVHAERPAAIPQITHVDMPASVSPPRPRTTARTMAVRRTRPLLQIGRRRVAAPPGAPSAAPHMRVADAPGHA